MEQSDDLRVVMPMHSFAPVLGGAQRQVEQLAPLLAAAGVRVTVVTRRPRGTAVRELRPGLEVVRVRAPGQRGVRAAAAYAVLGTAAAVRTQPDVVHAHDLLSPALVGALAGAWSRVPVVVKALSGGPHGDVARLRSKALGRHRMAMLTRRVAAFVCVSQDIETELADAGVPAERLHRVPNGVDVEHFRPATGEEQRLRRAELDVPPDGCLAVFCGRVTAVKRLDLLVPGLRDGSARLLVLGDGDGEAALRETARAHGVADRLHMRATLSDPRAAYHAADAFVTASAQDGMSNAVLEAMATGLPVVATRAAGMAELLASGAGELVPARSDALAASLADLARRPERRAQMGEAGRRRAVAHYSLAATARSLTELYRELTVAA
jgi:glycosyltransferase involved in cell wall biosynthesis